MFDAKGSKNVAQKAGDFHHQPLTAVIPNTLCLFYFVLNAKPYVPLIGQQFMINLKTHLMTTKGK
jgi:hypothetical protein